MMRSKVSGRGVWCDCCSAWTVTRAREKRALAAEIHDEAVSEDIEYERLRIEADERVEAADIWDDFLRGKIEAKGIRLL